MFNKKLLLLSASAIILSLLFSCAKEAEDTSASPSVTTTASETTVDRSGEDDLGDYDFNGHAFRILNRTNDQWANSRLDFTELTGDLYQDEVYLRNRKIEERFNFTIEMITYTDHAQPRPFLLAGTNDYDIFTGRNAEMFNFAQEGLLSSVSDMTYIDLSKSYWNAFLNDQLTVANKSYFAVSAFNFSNMDMSYVLTFNKKLIRDYGLESPFDLVKSGKWTYDKFAELAKAGTIDLDGNGTMTATDAWGYVARQNDVLPAFWISAGIKLIEKDKDDIPQSNLKSEKFITAFQKIFDITHGIEIFYQSDKTDMFINGDILFNDITPFTLIQLRNMEIDFGIIPYPKYDEEQEKYYTRIGGCELFGAPKSASQESLDRTSVILEAMSCESLKTVVPVYYELMVKTKLTRDTESAEIIDLIFENRVFDFADNLWVGELRDGPLNSMFAAKNSNIVSMTESMENIINTKRDKMVEAFEALDK